MIRDAGRRILGVLADKLWLFSELMTERDKARRERDKALAERDTARDDLARLKNQTPKLAHDVVRVVRDGSAYAVVIGAAQEWVWSASTSTHADEMANRIRRGLASLPAYLVLSGVTEEMRESFVDAWRSAAEAALKGSRAPDDDWVVAGMKAALTTGLFHVLAPGQGLVQVRIARRWEAMPPGAIYRGRHYWRASGGIQKQPNEDTPYILGSDLDAAAATLPKPWP